MAFVDTTSSTGTEIVEGYIRAAVNKAVQEVMDNVEIKLYVKENCIHKSVKLEFKDIIKVKE
jgi:hypothetical protein